MFLAQVKGTVVCTNKEPSLRGIKLLIVQLLDENQNPLDDPVVAIDSTGQAGTDELVFVVTGREAALAMDDWFNPADYAIVGIVDSADIDKEALNDLKIKFQSF